MPQPDRWLVLTAEAGIDDPLRDLVAEGLLALGGLSILEKGNGLTTYLPADAGQSMDAMLENASSFLADWLADDPPPLSGIFHDNEDWEREWKRGLQPRRVSDRFVIKPSWTTFAPEPGLHIIEIDPEMAFGTGEHPTTRGCLRLLDALDIAGRRVCDVGSGSAILAIACAMAGAETVVAVEYDPDANLNARDNIARNGVESRVRLIEAFADRQLLDREAPFGLILANILSSVIQPLLGAFHSNLEPSGHLIVSGILQTESEEVLEEARRAGFRLLAEDREEEWWSALLEPVAT